MPKRTVVLTAAGGAGTIEIIKSLKALGGYRVVALDASPHACGFAFSDEARLMPFATAPDYPRAIREVLDEYHPDVLIPLVDEEILLFHDLLDEPKYCEIKLLTPRREFCRICLDKWLLAEALGKAGLPAPRTWLAEEAGGAVYPAVIKPRQGRGSREVAYLAGPGDLSDYLERADKPPSAYIVQEQATGAEFTTSAIVGLDGSVLGVVPKEVPVKKGITQVGITRRAQSVDALCRDVQSRLKADGPFNVQHFLGPQGPSIIEINPRYSTTVALTIGAGVNEVDLVLRHAFGEAVEAPDFVPDLLMVRYSTQIFSKASDWPFPVGGKTDQQEES
jgi:carbamoyl-phosphate synthase large subunit